jgi:hypothetical protein
VGTHGRVTLDAPAASSEATGGKLEKASDPRVEGGRAARLSG